MDEPEQRVRDRAVQTVLKMFSRCSLKPVQIVFEREPVNTGTAMDFPLGTILHQEFENTSHL